MKFKEEAGAKQALLDHLPIKLGKGKTFFKEYKGGGNTVFFLTKTKLFLVEEEVIQGLLAIVPER